MKKSIALFLLMLLASISALSITPHHRMVDDLPQKIELNSLIPAQFNDWKAKDMAAQLVNPQVNAAIQRVYAQTLARTYVNTNGEVIMLSIAYGEDQSDSVGVHLPEGCYGGQGFNITQSSPDSIQYQLFKIPVTRVFAQKTHRLEPITYWLRTGNKLTYPGFETKLARLQYGITGKIPDGLLVRVSSLVTNNNYHTIESAYALHNRFVQDLIMSLSPEQRKELIGA